MYELARTPQQTAYIWIKNVEINQLDVLMKSLVVVYIKLATMWNMNLLLRNFSGNLSNKNTTLSKQSHQSNTRYLSSRTVPGWRLVLQETVEFKLSYFMAQQNYVLLCTLLFCLIN